MRFSYRDPLRNGNFVLLVSGQLVSQIGAAAFRIALILWVIDIADSPFALGVVTAAFLVPNLLTFAISGYFVDRLPRLRVMLSSDVARTLFGALLAVLTFAPDQPPLALVAVVYALFGVADAFFLPAYRATIPEILPADQLYPANAIDMVGRRLGLIVGPVLSALIYHELGAGPAFLINTATFGISAVTVYALTIRVRRRPDSVPARHNEPDRSLNEVLDAEVGSFFREASAGLRYVWRVRWLGSLMLAAAVVNAGAAASMDVVLPFYVREGWGEDTSLLGLVYGIQAAGAVIGAIVIGRSGSRRPGVSIALFLALMGLSVAGLSATWWIPVVLLLGLAYGFGVEASGVHWSTLMQTQVPGTVLGRVSAADYLISYSLMPLAVLGAGILLPAVGPQTSFLIIGAVMVTAAAFPLLVVSVRRLNVSHLIDSPDPQETEEE